MIPLTLSAALAQALEAHRRGDPSQAERLYAAILAADPDQPEALFNYGGLLLEHGRESAALAAYGRLLERHPDDAEALANRAYALLRLSRTQEALSGLQAAIVLRPDHAGAWSNRASLLIGHGEGAGALASADRALAAAGPFPDALHNRSIALFLLSRPGDALPGLRAVLAMKPDHGVVHHDLGTVLQTLGQGEGAGASAQRAAAIDPGSAEALTGVGNALKLQGRRDGAATRYRRALALRPDYGAAWGNLAYADLARADLPAALGKTRRAMIGGGTPEIQTLFVKCIGTPGAASRGLESLVVRALDERWARPSALASTAVALAKADPAVRRGLALASAAEGRPSRLRAEAGLLEGIADCRVLRRLMVSTPVCDVELERLLTQLRVVLLDLGSEEHVHVAPSVVALFGALARQCFLNAYVFACAEDEERRVAALRGAVSAALCDGRPVSAPSVLALAAYAPLHALAGIERLAAAGWPEAVEPVLAQQVAEPAEEHRLAEGIPRLTPITDRVSRAVARQYEESPYPPWVTTIRPGRPTSLGAYLRQTFPAPVAGGITDGEIDVLVAGCGTGQHPIETALSFRCRSVVAIDLSLASLAYARRKALELGLDRIAFAQADILELGSLDRSFDLIESSGVLHHLADPFAGWRALLGRLRPGGIMHLGFYSASARRHLDRARAFIAAGGYDATAGAIRRFRRDLLASGDAALIASVARSHDFFSLSACRDLLFHVQEHRLTLPEIGGFLRANDLRLIGFDVGDSVAAAYRARFPADPAMTDLDAWHRFETEDPEVFVGMYQFWVQAPGG